MLSLQKSKKKSLKRKNKRQLLKYNSNTEGIKNVTLEMTNVIARLLRESVAASNRTRAYKGNEDMGRGILEMYQIEIVALSALSF